MQLRKILSEEDSQESKDIMDAVNADYAVSGGIKTDGSREAELAARDAIRKAQGGKRKGGKRIKPKLPYRGPRVGGVPPPYRKPLAEGRDPNSLHKLLEYSAADIKSGKRTNKSGNRTGGSNANLRGDRYVGELRIQMGSGARGVHPLTRAERLARERGENNYIEGRDTARALGSMRRRRH